MKSVKLKDGTQREYKIDCEKVCGRILDRCKIDLLEPNETNAKTLFEKLSSNLGTAEILLACLCDENGLVGDVSTPTALLFQVVNMDEARKGLAESILNFIQHLDPVTFERLSKALELESMKTQKVMEVLQDPSLKKGISDGIDRAIKGDMDGLQEKIKKVALGALSPVSPVT